MQFDVKRLNTVARQYNFMRDDGLSHADAMDKLRTFSQGTHSLIVDKFATIRTNRISDDEFFAQHLGGLTEVVDEDYGNNAHPEAITVGAIALGSNLSELGATLRAMLLPRFVYLVALCLFGAAISTMYSIYIWPAFENMFGSFGATRPKSMFGLVEFGMYGYPLLFTIIGLAVLWLFRRVFKDSYNLSATKPFASPFHRLPGVTAVSDAINDFVHLSVRILLGQSGVDVHKQIDVAGKQYPLKLRDVEEALLIARNTETLHQETEHQRQLAHTAVLLNMKMMTRVLFGGLTVVVLVLLGSMIVNFYLPIFKMGAIVS